jgi:hypothetical protein
MTVPVTGSEPLATLLCSSAECGVVNGLRETARRCRDNGLHVRLYVFDDQADQREALLTPVWAIIWDGLSSWGDGPEVDGSPLEDVFGRDRRRIALSAAYLAAPTAYAACQKKPGKTAS